jgi:hypothetical protein
VSIYAAFGAARFGVKYNQPVSMTGRIVSYRHHRPEGVGRSAFIGLRVVQPYNPTYTYPDCQPCPVKNYIDVGGYVSQMRGAYVPMFRTVGQRYWH